MAVRTFNSSNDITDYYRHNIREYGLDNPRTMGYHTGPIDARLISNLLPEFVEESYSVLDVGCGLGQAIPILQSTFPSSRLVRFLGLDLVEEFTRVCAQNYLRYEFRTKDFLTWNSNERFDIVIAAGVLVSRVTNYEEYLERFVSKMVFASKGWIGFNVVSGRSERYTAKHLATISEDSLQHLLGKFPSVMWQIKKLEAFPGSEDTFVCGKIEVA